MSIVSIGSYNSFLSGWELKLNQQSEIKAEQLFGFKVDKNCIKTVAVSPDFLALGGTDDLVRLYDLTIKREVCTLMDHSGTINKIIITNGQMVCASEDGSISFYKLSKSRVEMINKIFVIKEGVIDIAVDSTGKICLCIGKKSMKVVDLFRGKIAFETKLTFDPESINWVHNDEFFCISHKNCVTVYNRKFEEFKILECDPKHLIRVTSSFDTLLIAGTDKGDVLTWDFITEEEIKAELKKEEEELEELKKEVENKEEKEEEKEEEEAKEESESDVSLNSDEEKIAVANLEEMENMEEAKEEVEGDKCEEEVNENKNEIDEELDEDLNEEVGEREYPFKEIIELGEGRIRGLQQIFVGEWTGFAVGFSDGTLKIIDREGNISLEMNTGMRITALGATSY